MRDIYYSFRTQHRKWSASTVVPLEGYSLIRMEWDDHHMPVALSFSLIFTDIHTSRPVFRTDRVPLSRNPWIMHVRNSRLSNLCCGNAAPRIRALHLAENRSRRNGSAFFRLDPSCCATFDVGARLTNHDFTENFTSRYITDVW